MTGSNDIHWRWVIYTWWQLTHRSHISMFKIIEAGPQWKKNWWRPPLVGSSEDRDPYTLMQPVWPTSGVTWKSFFNELFYSKILYMSAFKQEDCRCRVCNWMVSGVGQTSHIIWFSPNVQNSLVCHRSPCWQINEATISKAMCGTRKQRTFLCCCNMRTPKNVMHLLYPGIWSY